VSESDHLHAILSINKTEASDKPSFQYDSGRRQTFVVQSIDPRVYLVLIYAGLRQERDTNVTSFMNDIVTCLRGTKLLLQLKSPPK
ncbi:unnamed protein product, partial [Didymodactylos carnosus]